MNLTSRKSSTKEPVTPSRACPSGCRAQVDLTGDVDDAIAEGDRHSVPIRPVRRFVAHDAPFSSGRHQGLELHHPHRPSLAVR